MCGQECVCVCVWRTARETDIQALTSLLHTLACSWQFWEKSNLSLQIFRFNSKLLVTNHPTPGSTARIHKSPSLSFHLVPPPCAMLQVHIGESSYSQFQDSRVGWIFQEWHKQRFSFCLLWELQVKWLFGSWCACVRASKQSLGTSPKLRKVFTVV